MTRTARKAASVLLVEDYDDTRLMYRQYLEFLGFHVDEAQDGIEAFQKATALRPDIILMDLALPRMDGWEVSRRLKQQEATRRIPIVALTGHALEWHQRGAREAGCDDFVVKPCLPETLANKVRSVLGLDGPLPSAVGPGRAASGPSAARPKPQAARAAKKRAARTKRK